MPTVRRGHVSSEMWHEARRQERKIRGLMVDYKKRAERRREYYHKLLSNSNPTQYLRIYGRSQKIHYEAAVALAAEGPQSQMPWQGDVENMIDRFDVRAHLDVIPAVRKKDSDDDSDGEEKKCNYERYRTLVQNECASLSEEACLKQIEIEETFGSSDTTKLADETKKKYADKKAAIGFVYDDSTEQGTSSAKQSVDEDGANSDAESELSVSEMDLDVVVDIDELTDEQRELMNSCGVQFGMGDEDMLKMLEVDKEEAELLKQAKIAEEEKAQFSGRKSRRERRAFKDKIIQQRKTSPPSYAARDSPKYDAYNRTSTSRSKSRSPEPCAAPEFITSFGGESSDEGKFIGPSLPPHLRQSSREPASRSSKKDKTADHSLSNLKIRARKNSASLSRSRSRSGSKSRSQRLDSHSRSRSQRSRSRSSRSYSRRSRSRSRSRFRRDDGYRSRRTRSRSPPRSSWSSRRKSRSRSRSSRRFTSRRGRTRSRSRSRSRSNGRASYWNSSSSNKRRYSSSSSTSRSRSRSYSSSADGGTKQSPCRKSPGTSATAGATASTSASSAQPTIKRYRRAELSSSNELSDSDDEKTKSKRDQNKPPQKAPPNSSSKVPLIKIGGDTGANLTPQEKLRRRMQAALNKQYKQDKRVESEKRERTTQAQLDREEEMRVMAAQMRKRERERRYREQEDTDRLISVERDGKRTKSSSSSRSRSPASPSSSPPAARRLHSPPAAQRLHSPPAARRRSPAPQPLKSINRSADHVPAPANRRSPPRSRDRAPPSSGQSPNRRRRRSPVPYGSNKIVDY